MKLFLPLILAPFLSAWFFSTQIAKGQECPNYYDSVLNQKVFTFVDEMPEYIGGKKEVVSFFAENFNYPKQQEFQGKLLLEFIVDPKGKLINCGVKDKKREEWTLVEKEAVRVFELMPLWNSGRCNGKEVYVLMNWPITL